MCYVRTLTGVDANGIIAIGSLIVVLWIASMGAAWKIATILAAVANELKDMREKTEENAQNISAIQSRFNIPQARNGDVPMSDTKP
jgi:uncharacterized protein (DUF608 family)